MRILLGVMLYLALLVPGLAQDPSKPNEGAAFYSRVETYLLDRRQSLLDEESAMVAPLWIGNTSEIFLIEEAEYRRIMGLLRDWRNSGSFDADAIQHLPPLDRYLFERLGAGTIGDMEGARLDAHVVELRPNRDRLLNQFETALDYIYERFNDEVATAASEAQPDIYRVFESTYGEIHWEAGYYGNPNNTIAVEDIYEDRDLGGWVVAGRWGRANDPDRHGGFEFVFGSPCTFAGSWWYTGHEQSNATNWTGQCQ